MPGRARISEEVLARVTGAPLIGGNSLRLLKDGAANYAAWKEALASARRWIHFETFLIHDDEVGREFAQLLATKAREGVRVRLLCDWVGTVRRTSRRFWRVLREAGVETRFFNPPEFVSPFAWLSRDHRKMIGVDGQVAFVTGVCLGRMWLGDPARGVDPWRDTGLEVRGPAVADIEQAFAQSWAQAGPPLPDDEIPRRHTIPPCGEVRLRVIAGTPNTAGLYRLDHFIAAAARRYLWLTDAYFVATTSYVQALCTAARDGVDVRLLAPGSSDIPLVAFLSRAMYRPLLEAGVRVFEWNGSMLHAKTAVADRYWARVGSTNLNLSSWLGNWELDIVAEDERFARTMEEMYLEDLEHATEIVLTARRRVMASGPPHPRRRRRSRMAVGALGISSAVGASIANLRVLGPAEARVLAAAAGLLLAVSILALLWPWAITVPAALVGLWIALTLLVRAWQLHRRASAAADPAKKPQ
ncbi:MAG: phospholipase D-like domain-containing protein [Bryobacteraceae bacterium]